MNPCASCQVSILAKDIFPSPLDSTLHLCKSCFCSGDFIQFTLKPSTTFVQILDLQWNSRFCSPYCLPLLLCKCLICSGTFIQFPPTTLHCIHANIKFAVEHASNPNRYSPLHFSKYQKCSGACLQFPQHFSTAFISFSQLRR